MRTPIEIGRGIDASGVNLVRLGALGGRVQSSNFSAQGCDRIGAGKLSQDTPQHYTALAEDMSVIPAT